MIPNCTTPLGLRNDVHEALAAKMDGLRTRMLRDLELFLSQALSCKGEQRLIKLVDRSKGDGYRTPAGRRCA